MYLHTYSSMNTYSCSLPFQSCLDKDNNRIYSINMPYLKEQSPILTSLKAKDLAKIQPTKLNKKELKELNDLIQSKTQELVENSKDSRLSIELSEKVYNLMGRLNKNKEYIANSNKKKDLIDTYHELLAVYGKALILHEQVKSFISDLLEATTIDEMIVEATKERIEDMRKAWRDHDRKQALISVVIGLAIGLILSFLIIYFF